MILRLSGAAANIPAPFIIVPQDCSKIIFLDHDPCVPKKKKREIFNEVQAFLQTRISGLANRIDESSFQGMDSMVEIEDDDETIGSRMEVEVINDILRAHV